MDIKAGDYVIVNNHLSFVPEFAHQTGKATDITSTTVYVSFDNEITYSNRTTRYWELHKSYLEKINLNKRVKAVK